MITVFGPLSSFSFSSEAENENFNPVVTIYENLDIKCFLKNYERYQKPIFSII